MLLFFNSLLFSQYDGVLDSNIDIYLTMNFTEKNTNISEDLLNDDIISPSPVDQAEPISVHPDNIHAFILVNYVILCNSIAVFGILSNVVNALVFYKQGFTEAITVSLFAMSLSDLCQLVMVVLVSNFHIPMLVVRSNFTVFLNRLIYFVCGILRICFSRISIWITVLITLERCVCILLPLKVRVIFTSKRVAVVIAVISFVIFVASTPVFASVKVVTSINLKTNATFNAFATSNLGSSMEDVSVVSMMLTQISSLIFVIVCNALLLLGLKRRKQRWVQGNVTRQASTANQHISALSVPPVGNTSDAQSARMSTLNVTVWHSTLSSSERPHVAQPSGTLGTSTNRLRDRKLSRMVVIISVILLVSFLPSSMWFCLTRIRPEFQVQGR